MAKPGPKPTPTAILRLRGSKRVTKARERAEVRGPEGAPSSPVWLDKDARKIWAELLPMLAAMGVLSEIDGNALGRYCCVLVRWKKAQAFIRTHGETYPVKDDNGKTKCFHQWPQVAIINRLAVQLSQLEQEFGMTPSARTRIQISPKAKEAARGKARFFEAS